MTCIVALKHKGKVYMGGDSAGIGGVNSYSLTQRADRKVFINGGMIFGFTDSFRMGQILRFGFTPPRRGKKSIYGYMVTDFIDAVRKRFSDCGYLKKVDEAEEGGLFLVGFEGRLFSIECDFQVGESIHDFDAVGCGSQIALGSMFSSKGLSPRKRVLNALEAAETFSAGVRKPFIIRSL